MPSINLIFVVDTSALIGQPAFAASTIPLATVPLIAKEMVSHGLKEHLDVLQETGKLRILDPSQTALNTVLQTAEELGDLPNLSMPDRHLLALAVDLSQQHYRVIILTDDYSIQNVAKRLKLKSRTPTQRGIRDLIQWTTYCPACQREFPHLAKGTACPLCGTALKRRAVNKQRIQE